MVALRADPEWDAQVVETFPFSRILRWVSADSRSSNKGDANQLDLQINIPGVGKKDLRVQFASPPAVKETLGEIDGTVKELMEQRRKQMTPLTAFIARGGRGRPHGEGGGAPYRDHQSSE